MYGQARGKGYEVRLVRMSPWDERTRRGRRNRRRTAARTAVVLAVMLATFSACMGMAAFSCAPDGTEVTVVPGSEALSAGLEEDSAQAPAPEIKVLEEQLPEPENPLVVIDPGHGGVDEGCSADGVQEKDINLEVAQRTAAKLRDMGLDVILTRENGETAVSLEERVALAEEAEADIFVSIHQNSFEGKGTSAKGIETWYCGRDRDCRRLAQLVHKGALGKTKAGERELHEGRDLYVTRETSMPACLIETGFLSNAEERKKLCDSAYQEKLAEGIAEGIYLYFYPKTMYLTFDDGPSEQNTTAVLDILKEHGIKATFFVVGENVQKHPEVARRIVEEGHTIGIHCNRHKYDEIYESTESYLADFQAAWDTVCEVTGVEVKLFRFPGGSINCYNREVYEDIIAQMTERGYIYFDWNGSLEDAVSRSTPEQLVENGVKSTLGRKKVVMLAHDIVYNTTLCLEELIDSLPEYQMKPLTEEVKPVQF